MTTPRPLPRTLQACLVLALLAAPAAAQTRRLGDLELAIRGFAAVVDPLNPVLVKNVPGGVHVAFRSGAGTLGAAEAAARLGGAFRIEGELSGPDVAGTLTVPLPDAPPADPDVIPLPGLRIAGDYDLTNLRIVRVSDGVAVMDVAPAHVTVRVIDQVLVTGVQTRTLTLDEIRARGVILDSDDYQAFEFGIGLQLDSGLVSFSLPVVFDSHGVVVPLATAPPPLPIESTVQLPYLAPMMLSINCDRDPQYCEGDGPGSDRPPIMNGGAEIRIPSLLVIPGNVGYLNQFFAAQLLVANGAPAGSGLSLHEVKGTIHLPPGENGDRPPLALAELASGPQDVLPVRGAGPDNVYGTGDDTDDFEPGQQGRAEFTVRGDLEGYHTIHFDVDARLDGLATGPVHLRGAADGGVLVRNPYFDLGFVLPSVVRTDEEFDVFLTVRNIGQVAANLVSVNLDANAFSNAELIDPDSPVPGVRQIQTIPAGGSHLLTYHFRSLTTGKVVASYLKTTGAGAGGGSIHFKLGVGERGVPLSPDTLVLPSAVDSLPPAVVRAAMRVLGQAWSIANAPPGTLPAGVLRTTKAVVTRKALAIAEAGLRARFGQSPAEAVRDIALDLHAGSPLDPGFDQLLRTTEAGRDLDRAIGAALAGAAQDEETFLRDLSEAAAANGGGIVLLAEGRVGSQDSPFALSVESADGGILSSERGNGVPASTLKGGGLLPLGPYAQAPLAGIVGKPSAVEYRVELVASEATTAARLLLGVPLGTGQTCLVDAGPETLDAGGLLRAKVTPGSHTVSLQVDRDGTGPTPASNLSASCLDLPTQGPRLISANVIGPESFAGASQLGVHTVLVFDRPVSPASAADLDAYTIPKNRMVSASAQLSGRVVIGTLEQPEGPYVPTTLRVDGIEDVRGVPGPSDQKPLVSHLTGVGAIVTGHVLEATGQAVSALVTYTNLVGPEDCGSATRAGVAALQTDENGRFEFRFVPRLCGPFEVLARDPDTGALRRASQTIRVPGETIDLPIVLLGRGSVAGTVKDLDGGVVQQAYVRVASDSEPQVGVLVRSGLDGTYLATNLPVGPITVSAAKGLSAGSNSGRLDRAGNTATIDVTLNSAAGEISGTVTVVQGSQQFPLRNGPVYYKLYVPETNTWVLAAGAVTDAAGQYSLNRVPAGSYSVEVSAYGATATRSGTLTTQNPTQTVDLVLELAPPSSYVHVQGTVYAGNVGAPGVTVTSGASGALTNAFGQYDLIVRPGTQTINASSPDGRTGSTSVTVTESISGVDIHLSGVGSATFVVKGPDGQALSNVMVYRGCPGGASPCGCAPQRTNQSGGVTWSNLPVGNVSARAFYAGAWTEVAAGSTRILQDGHDALGVIDLKGVGTVRGHVTVPSGVNVTEVAVDLSSAHYDSASCAMLTEQTHRASPGSDGMFSFSSVGVGAFAARAVHPFAPTPAAQSGTLTQHGQQASVELTLVSTTAGKLSGTVFLPDNASPVGAGVLVKLEGALPPATVQTDGASHYQFPSLLPAGSYQITAIDPVTGGQARGMVALQVGQDLHHDIRLRGLGTVRVVVVDEHDVPLPNARVKLQEAEFPSRSFERSIDTEGGATFPGIFEGRFAAEAFDVFGRGGRVAGVVPAAGASVEVRLRVTATGRVHGRFVDVTGVNPVPNGTVRLLAGSGVLGQALTASSGSDAGTFSFDYVPLGPVRLEALDPLTGRTGVAVGELEGADLDLTIQAQAIGKVRGQVTGDGAAQVGARVELTSGDYRAVAVTDGSGSYEVAGVPEGRVVAKASLGNGFLAGSASGNLVGEGAILTLDVALHDSGSVRGRVAKATGEGRLASVDATVAGSSGTFSTYTDAEGQFDLLRIPSGTATLRADVLGSIDRGTAQVDVPPGGEALTDIVLNGVGRLIIHTENAEGNPVPGLVSVTNPYAFYGRDGYYSGNGTVNVPEAAVGPITVSFTGGADGSGWPQCSPCLWGVQASTIVADQDNHIHVRLQPTFSVHGRVLKPGATGTVPAFGTLLTLSPLGLTSQAGTDGTFRLQGLPLQAYTLKAVDPISQGIALRAVAAGVQGQDIDLGDIVLDYDSPTVSILKPTPGEVRLPFGGTLEASLADLGTGIDFSTFRVQYGSDPRNTQGPAAFTFQDGKATGPFATDLLREGDNTLTVRVQDKVGNLGSATVTFKVVGGTWSGTVRSFGPGAAPVASAPVQFTGPTTKTLTTGDTGEFGAAGFRPGNYTVTATDPHTGLSTSVSLPVLFDGESGSVDLVLPAAVSVDVFVKRAAPGGWTPVTGAHLTTSGGRTATETAPGHYGFTNLPVGTYVIDATLPDGDLGRTTVNLAAAQNGQTVSAPDIEMNGVGSVVVTVLDAHGDPAQGARVTIASSAPLAPGYAPKTTASSGTATFDRVLAGTVTASASATTGAQVASTSGLLVPGATLPLTVNLPVTGRIEGVVREAGPGPVVPGATVRIAGRTATTDPGGAYAIDGLAVGTYGVEVWTAQGDQGKGTGVVPPSGGITTVDVTLNGLATLVVDVKEPGTGDPAAGAHVSVDALAPFQDHWEATTGTSGQVTIEHVLTGQVKVSATRGSQSAPSQTLELPPAGGQASLTLSGFGTLDGHVRRFGPGAAVEGALVYRSGSGTPVLTDGQGAFRFADLPLGTYTLTAQFEGRSLAQASATLTAHGDTVTRDLELVAHGTVRGAISPAGTGGTVTLQASGPFGGARFQAIASDGTYEFRAVPAGAFTLSATRGADRADATGLVQSDGETVVQNLSLISSAITLPYVAADGNLLNWRVETTGALSHGSSGTVRMMGGDTPRLTLTKDGQASVFAPTANSVATEENRREFVLQQTVQGLSVTRKVFVPADGYFIRYLDVITNPGPEPVNVDLAWETRVGGGGPVDSSSGDSVLSPDDTWAVFDDSDTRDIYDVPSTDNQFAPLAIVVAGQDDPQRGPMSVVGSGLDARESSGWSLQLGSGESVAFLHLYSAQADRARARAAAERLRQLPPEVLAGVSSSEAGLIRNFAVPTDLHSGLQPLLLDGIVTGELRSGDGQITGAGADFRLRTRSPYYGRPGNWLDTYSTTGRTDGSFRIAPSGADPVLPRAPFDVEFRRQAFGLDLRHTVSGDFAETGVIELTRVVGSTLSNSATATGIPAQALDGDPRTQWQGFAGGWIELGLPGDATLHEVTLLSYAMRRARVEAFDAPGSPLYSGSIDLTVARPGTLVLPTPTAGVRRVRVTSEDPFSYTSVAEFQVRGEAQLGRTGHAELQPTFAGTGAVRGAVQRFGGAPMAAVSVSLKSPQGSLSLNSGSDGAFVFTLIPAGSYTLEASHPLGGFRQSVAITVPSDTVVDQDVVFDEMGSLQVDVHTAVGTAAAATLTLTAPGFSRQASLVSAGNYLFAEVPPGDYTLTAVDPRSGATVTSAVSVVAGAVTTPRVDLPPVGRVDVTVLAGQVGVASALVSWQSSAVGSGFVGTALTGGSGFVSLANVAGGPPGDQAVIRAEYPNTGGRSSAQATVTISEGQTVPVTIEVPGVGRVVGTLQSRSGTPLAGSVRIFDGGSSNPYVTLTAGGDGAFATSTPANVPVGPLRLVSQFAEGYGSYWAYSTASVDRVLLAHGDTLTTTALGAVGTLTPSQRTDAWSFDATPGESVSFMMLGYGSQPLTNPYLEVLGPDGEVVASNDDISASDHNSRVTFTAPTAGTYVVLASGAGSGDYRLASYTWLVPFREYSGPLPTTHLHGRVTAGAGALVVPGATVTLNGESRITDAAGLYSFDAAPRGGQTVEASFAGVSRSFDVGVHGADVSKDFDLPVVTRLHGTVTNGTSAIPDAVVEVAGGSSLLSATTNASGAYAFATVLYGSYQVTARAGGAESSTPVVLDSADQQLDFTLAIGATLHGRVFAADSTTALEGATVQVGSLSATTDATGTYSLADVPPGLRTVTASYGATSNSVQVDVTVPSTLRNFTLPVGLIKGHILESDGRGIVADVELCFLDSGYHYICNGTMTTSASDGSYLFVNLPAGIQWAYLTATARDGSGGQAYASQGASSTGASIVDIAFPPAGNLEIQVADEHGTAVPFADVAVAQGDNLLRWVVTNQDGYYRWPRLAEGEYRVYAEEPQFSLPGSTSVLVTAGPDVLAPVSIVPAEIISGSLQDAGGAPVGGATVHVDAHDAPRLYDSEAWRNDAITDPGTGHFELHVPLGLYNLTGEPGPCPDRSMAGKDGELQAGSPQNVTLIQGEAVGVPRLLQGGGNTYGSSLCGSALPLPSLKVAGVGSEAIAARPASPGDSLRSLRVSGPSPLRVQWHDFVPDSGEFARRIVALSNPTDAPISALMTTRLALEPWQLSASSSGGTEPGVQDSWIMIGSPDVPEVPLYGIVFGLLPDALNYRRTWDEGGRPFIETGHTLTVPAHGSLLFAVFTAPSPTADLMGGLAHGTHPGSLAGLTDEELAALVNIAPARLRGGVVDAGSAPVVGAQVAILSAGVVASRATTGEGGIFELPSPPDGSYDIVATGPDGSSGGANLDVVGGSASFTLITLLSQPGSATLQVHAVADEGGGDLAGREIVLSVNGNTVVWGTTGSDGMVVFSQLPAGNFHLQSGQPPDFGSAQGYLPDGSSIEVLLTIGASQTGIQGTVPGGPGALVRLDGLQGAVALESTAGPAGEFLFTHLPVGVYRLSAVATDGRPGLLEGIQVVEDQLTQVVLPLADAGALGSVQLQAALDGPGSLEGLLVELGVQDGPYASFWSATATLDSQGVAVVASVPPGTVSATVISSPYQGAGQTQVVAGQVASLALTVGQPARVSGVVRDAGSGVAATVFARAFTGGSAGGVASTATQPDGSFTFSGLAPGDYTLVAFAGADGHPGRVDLHLSGGADASQDIELADPAQLATLRCQKVTDDQGAAIGSGSIQVCADLVPFCRSLDVDGFGWAEFANLLPGRQVVQVLGQEPELAYEVVRLQAGQFKTLPLPVGSRAYVPLTLSADDGISRQIWGDGEVIEAQADCSSGCGLSLRQAAGAWSFPQRPVGRVATREFSLGSEPREDGLEVTRRVFVPQSGRFERFLEVLHNPGSQPVSVDLLAEQQLTPRDGSSWALSSSSSGGPALVAADRWVAVESAAAATPALAMVLRGAGSLEPAAVEWSATAQGLAFGPAWALSVPPGETVILMHFLVRGTHGDAASVAGIAEALSALTEPEALAGIDPADQLLIANFVAGHAPVRTASPLRASLLQPIRPPQPRPLPSGEARGEARDGHPRPWLPPVPGQSGGRRTGTTRSSASQAPAPVVLPPRIGPAPRPQPVPEDRPGAHDVRPPRVVPPRVPPQRETNPGSRPRLGSNVHWRPVGPPIEPPHRKFWRPRDRRLAPPDAKPAATDPRPLPTLPPLPVGPRPGTEENRAQNPLVTTTEKRS